MTTALSSVENPGNKKLFAIAQILGLSAAATGLNIDGFLSEC